MKCLKVILLLILLTSSVYANYRTKERVSVLKEYKMMKLCIDDKDTLFVSYEEARDNCACSIENLSNKIVRAINSLKFNKSILNEIEEILSKKYENCEN